MAPLVSLCYAKERSELVALNMNSVTGVTPRHEIAGRVEACKQWSVGGEEERPTLPYNIKE